MTVATLSREAIADSPDVLLSIREADVSIAIWERELPVALDGRAFRDLHNLRFHTSMVSLPATLSRHMDEAGFGRWCGREALVDDIQMLARHFAKIMDMESLELRLEHVATNACRKFHADYVSARLICTYAGPGTQWLDGSSADVCDCGDHHDIRQLGTGHVAILKGRRWSEQYPAIHRSPPVEGTGQERLVLVINPGAA